MTSISYDDFWKVEIRVGRIVDVQEFPKARKPAYQLRIDFGEHGIRQSSAQITKLYTPADLLGRQVVAVTNFPPKRVANFDSEVLVLGVETEDGNVVLLGLDHAVPLGHRIS